MMPKTMEKIRSMTLAANDQSFLMLLSGSMTPRCCSSRRILAVSTVLLPTGADVGADVDAVGAFDATLKRNHDVSFSSTNHLI